MDAAKGKRVVFRTLDIGSDKVLPYMKPQDEPNPALGWRAIRVGWTSPASADAVAGADPGGQGRPLTVMFPFIAQRDEYPPRARGGQGHRPRARLGHRLPETLEVGAMLETPSLAFAPDRFFDEVGFPVDRRQRSEAVLLCRRPRKRTWSAGAMTR
jgi:phosphotransferase system enzyme I (PtsP)